MIFYDILHNKTNQFLLCKQESNILLKYCIIENLPRHIQKTLKYDDFL